MVTSFSYRPRVLPPNRVMAETRFRGWPDAGTYFHCPVIEA